MEISIQILSGGFLQEAVPYELTEKKLSFILSRLPVTKVLMGWSPDKSLYKKTAEFLAKRNVEFYLWLPVFSETGALKSLAPLKDLTGREILKDGENSNEDFFFNCPNNKENIKKILEIFNENFASIPFTGVFLDKIRYPSFAGEYGSRGVFSCFCRECRAVYEKANLDIEKLKAAFCAKTITPLGVTEYRFNGNYIFKDEVISDFFRLKAGIIYSSMNHICAFFRERGYSIGFDVFAPFLAPFAGQDISKLCGLCDFIKPMMYRVTNAPAGLPFETEALLKQTNTNKKDFFKLLGINTDDKSNPFNLEFAIREMQEMSKLSSCPVYAGIEINRVEEIAPADTAYIEETVKAYAQQKQRAQLKQRAQTGIQGLALSWNLLDMPEENICKIAELIK